MNYEVKNYIESLGARFNHRGCPEEPNGEWILIIHDSKGKAELHIPKEAIEGGYFHNQLGNPITLKNLKEIIASVDNPS